MWKEATRSNFRYAIIPAFAWRNWEKTWKTSGPRFEPRSSRLRSRSINHSTKTLVGVRPMKSVKYTYFPNLIFTPLNISLNSMLIYCIHKYVKRAITYSRNFVKYWQIEFDIKFIDLNDKAACESMKAIVFQFHVN